MASTGFGGPFVNRLQASTDSLFLRRDATSHLVIKLITSHETAISFPDNNCPTNFTINPMLLLRLSISSVYIVYETRGCTWHLILVWLFWQQTVSSSKKTEKRRTIDPDVIIFSTDLRCSVIAR